MFLIVLETRINRRGQQRCCCARQKISVSLLASQQVATPRCSLSSIRSQISVIRVSRRRRRQQTNKQNLRRIAAATATVAVDLLLPDDFGSALTQLAQKHISRRLQLIEFEMKFKRQKIQSSSL
jgi:hypothetical protein